MSVLLKSTLFLFISIGVHYAGKIQSDFLHCFTPVYESMFQHAKIMFYAYWITSAIEFLIIRNKSIKEINRITYLFDANMLKETYKASKSEYIWNIFQNSLTIIWIMMLVYYIPSSFIGAWESFAMEFVWALIATWITGFCTICIEKKVWYKPVIIFLIVTNIYMFVRFTFEKPWTDFFNEAKVTYEE